MDALQKAVLATELLMEKFGLDPIFLEALRMQSGEPWARLAQQNEAMADVLWEVAKIETGLKAEEPSPPDLTPALPAFDANPSPKKRGGVKHDGGREGEFLYRPGLGGGEAGQAGNDSGGGTPD